MGSTPARRALLGLLLTAAVGTVGFFGTRFAQGAFADDYRIWVTVGETGQGIIAGSDVVARGVIVGEVGQIRLNEDLEAVVELILEPRYTVPADAMFVVSGKTLLGEKQVEIRFDGPFDAAEFVAEGDTVSDPDRVVELQDVLQDLDGLFGAIDPVDLAVVIDDGLGAFAGQEEAIARAVDQGARATDVFARSLDDQVPGLRDLSLVAEALGPVGDEFNRLGTTIDGGALRTITDNQVRLRALLASLAAFGDRLDVVLTLTRPDLDRLIVQGDNVTRLLFTYRPEVAELLTGISDYADTIGNGGLTDPGFVGFAAAFQIIIDETEPFEPFCTGVPPDLAAAIPLCAAGEAAPPPDEPAEGGEDPVPGIPEPAVVLSVPGATSGAPELPVRGGLDSIVSGLIDGGALAEGALR